MTTIRELWETGTELLEKSGIEEARLDAWLLLEFRLGISRSAYWTDPERPVSAQDQEQVMELYRRRAQRIPLQHVTGEAWFYGRRFLVNENVLIPRQDTEILVEETLKRLEGQSRPFIVDLCTGSGCILLTLLKEREDASGLGVDISEEALKMAAENARLTGAERAVFSRLDVLQELDMQRLREETSLRGGCHALVSNPPYIPSDEIRTLMDEVRLHEPGIALDGGEDGLVFYRRISETASSLLTEGGWLITEIGCAQASSVCSLYEKAGFDRIRVIQDLNGLDRVICCEKP